MSQQRDPRARALIALLHNVRNRRALARNPLLSQQSAIAPQLPAIVDELIDELGSESEQARRRFAVLRRSDLGREEHTVIASDIGLSRSQFYRDLHNARELLGEALDQRLGGVEGTNRATREGNTRFVAIEALRSGGRYDRACEMASGIARDGDAVEAIRALCLRGELETELGAFADARRTAGEARRLLAHVESETRRSLLDAACDLVDADAAHCQGRPRDAASREALIDALRQAYRPGDRERAELLVRALVADTSVRFQQGDTNQSLARVDEALALAAREPIEDCRLAVDAKVRGSGVRALRADQVSVALREAEEIVEAGSRRGDIRTLRVGMQMMSSHLLTLGRLEEAKRFALEARSLIDLFGSTLDRAIVLSNLARIDILRRAGGEALRWIRLARALPCDAFTITHALAISEAEALVLDNQSQRALESVQALNARVGAWPRLTGRAKLAETIALAALNRTQEARTCSERALEASDIDGTPLLQARALEVHASLTGSVRSQRRLRDLQQALSA